MPDARTGHVMRICNAIAQHLERNPCAADTAKGIADFWLTRAEGDHLQLVVAALHELQRQGVVSAETLADGTVIYRKAGSSTQ